MTELAYRPYRDESRDFLYNLLFCDDRALFAPKDGRKPKGALAAVLADDPDVKALRAIAADADEEGRVRALAYNRLREMRQVVPAHILLGTIVEVSLADGLDALAVYVDGGVRYINHAGDVTVVDGNPAPAIRGKADAVIAASVPIVEKIGPWDHPRRPPPTADHARLTFLVSDGLYFGEGPFGTLAREAISAPLIAAATELLQMVVDATLRK